MKCRHTQHSGFALLESLLGIALLSLFFVILVGTVTYTEHRSLVRTMRAEAVLLAEEGLEASRSIRNQDYTLLASGTHGITKTNGYWEFQGTNDTSNSFTREVTIIPIDASTTEVVTRITWGEGSQGGDTELSTILTNWQNAP